MALVDSLPDTQRVVITGRGTVNAIGLNLKESVDALEKGLTGITTVQSALGHPINREVGTGGFVKNFDPELFLPKNEVAARIHRSAALFCAAATEAELDSGILKDTPPPFKGAAENFIADLFDPKWRAKNPEHTPERYGVSEGSDTLLQVPNHHRWGVLVGTGVGGTPFAADMEAIQLYQLLKGRVEEALLDEVFSSFGRRVKSTDGKPLRASAGDILKILPERDAMVKAMKSGYRGPGGVYVAACTSALIAMGLAANEIKLGNADGMLTGGSEAGNDRIGYGAFNTMGALTKNENPLVASRPFDKEADGFDMGEGAGGLIIESLASARKRGVRIYAELLGYANNLDAHHDTAPREGGEGAVRVMRTALEKAGLDPEEIDYINAHGTSTPTGDGPELDALMTVFGPDKIARMPIISLKSYIAHTLGASGAVEAALLVELMQRGFLPANLNLIQAIRQGYNLPTELIYFDHDIVMKNSLGFGGINATMILRRWRGN